MSYAEDVGIRPPMTNPARRIKMIREGRRERFLSEEEIGRAAGGHHGRRAIRQDRSPCRRRAASVLVVRAPGAGAAAAAQWRAC